MVTAARICREGHVSHVVSRLAHMRIVGRNFEFPVALCFTFLDDPLYLIMVNPSGEATCECLRAAGGDARTQESFNVHEIDEEESETEETGTAEQPDRSASAEEDENAAAGTRNASDNEESVYTGDSFCSDESCDEYNEGNDEITSRSPTSSLPCVGDVQRSRSSKERWKDDESCSLGDRPRAATASRLAKPRRCRRWNMSFTDEEMRKIERENELLLRKIMAQQKPRHRIVEDERAAQPRTSSSAINRKKLQKKIESDNMLLLRRIQQAKSCVLSNASKMSCRLTFL